MDAGGAKSLSALGFLTVVDSPQHGLFGGLLVLNPSGHPIEFHCTAPVKPNRAQQILYGPTLETYLYGHQIGQTLVSKSKRKPPVILTDVPPVLALRECTTTPVVLVEPTTDATTGEPVASEPQPSGQSSEPPPSEDAGDETATPGAVYRLDAAHAGGAKSATFRIGAHQLAMPRLADDSTDRLVKQLTTVAGRIDLAEPFERIRQAIVEAQRVGD